MSNPKSSKSRLRRFHNPKFSIAALFYLTACVAVVVTISPKQGSDGLRWNLSVAGEGLHYALHGVGTVGAIGGLLLQANRLANSRGFWLARGCRYGGLVALLVTLLLQTALRRNALELPERRELLTIPLQDVFPDSLWYVLLIVAGSLLSARAGTTHRWSSVIRALIASLGLAAGATFAALVAGNLSTTPFLVHVAMAGIELAQPLEFHRQAIYPDHVGEGFATYRLALVSFTAVFATAGLIAYAMQTRKTRRAVVARMLALAGITWLGWYGWWFRSHEFTRISPDLASIDPVGSSTDALFAVVMCVIISAWFASLLVQRRGDSAVSTKLTDSQIGAIALWLMAISFLGNGALLAYDVLGSFNEIWGMGFFGNTIHFWETFGFLIPYLLSSPSILLQTALALVGLRLLRVAWRGEPVYVAATPLAPFLEAWLWLLALGFVAVPTLAAYSFCSWLGPWWR